MDELIKTLTAAYGHSGFEDQMRDLIRPEVEPYVDEIYVDAMGNLITRKKGDGSGRKILVAAHMDEIGVMVSHITEKGFLRFTNIGGVFPHTLMGGRVQFANGTVGVVYSERVDDWSKINGLDKHYIDVGATSPEDCPVEVGDAAGFVRPLLIQGNHLIAKTMDDRIGCVVMIEALKRLPSTPHDLYFVFSVQEEVGTRGAEAVANRLNPEISLAVDITVANDMPGAHNGSVSLGKGTAIKVKDMSMIAHAGLVSLMKQRAKDANIPYQLEVLERGSTDARAFQVANAGSIAGCISIPTRYAHSQSETVHRSDVEASINLLLELVTKPIDL